MKVKIDYSEFLPRTQQDRYTHAIVEQLMLFNEKLEKLIELNTSKEVIEVVNTVQEGTPVELPKKPRRKKKEE
jgi:tRNA(Glu) U13 pseudouridine synthase TruD